MKDFDDLKKTKSFPNQHYRFPVSNEPLASNFIVNPEQISPLIKSSEERIKALEKEVCELKILIALSILNRWITEKEIH